MTEGPGEYDDFVDYPEPEPVAEPPLGEPSGEAADEPMAEPDVESSATASDGSADEVPGEAPDEVLDEVLDEAPDDADDSAVDAADAPTVFASPEPEADELEPRGGARAGRKPGSAGSKSREPEFTPARHRAESQRGGSLKWGLVAVTILAVVAVALVGVVLFSGVPETTGGTASSGTSTSSSGIASTGDTGPVAVITSDPSCIAWTSISTNLGNTLSLLGQGAWVQRDQAIPASEWDENMRKQYLAAGQVIRSAAAQAVGLVKLTPHRVMRELYEQFIAYTRAFVEHIPSYTAQDANLAGAAHSAASALAAICAATHNGSAAARGPLVDSQPAPVKVAPVGNPTNPQRMLTATNQICHEWQAAMDKFGHDTEEWQQVDPSVPATFWNPQQKSLNMAVGPVMISFANKLQQLGRRANNPVVQDFAELSAQYRRAFVAALATYDPNDNYLANASIFAATTVLGACGATGG